MRIVVGITGASGAAYAVRLIEELADSDEVILVMSEAAKTIISEELGIDPDEIEELVGQSFDNAEMG
ncbi:MAG: hypothetical protein KAX31_01850, partial [Thermoplasmata archaeon]|nr:hypothetical protein [Thermoplasmata archaeon]